MKFMKGLAQDKTNCPMPYIAHQWNILPKGVMDGKSLCTFKTNPGIFMVEKSIED